MGFNLIYWAPTGIILFGRLEKDWKKSGKTFVFWEPTAGLGSSGVYTTIKY